MEKPEFSPYGRYLINVDERKVPGPNYFHDTYGIVPECNLDAVPKTSKSRFNNPKWAASRGFIECQHCTERTT
jgi:hypothetical protein